MRGGINNTTSQPVLLTRGVIWALGSGFWARFGMNGVKWAWRGGN